MTSRRDQVVADAPDLVQADALADAAALAARGLVRNTVEALSRGHSQDSIAFSTPAPFSRADAADYLRLVALWNQHGGPDLEGIARRDCPACASTDHGWQFQSYDRYPFHGCRQCGTLFVPYAIDMHVIAPFLAAVPDACTIVERMTAARESRTKAADRARFAHYFALLRPLLRAKGYPIRYLDIGCGVGHSVELAQELGFDAIGVEISKTALATARAHGRNVLDPAGWGAPHDFDLISLFETLEHVTDPDAMIRQARAWLAGNGALILTLPNAASWEVSLLRQRCFHVFGGVEGVGHINLFTHAGLISLLQRQGLDLVHCDGQFSSNVLEIAAGLIDTNFSALAGFDNHSRRAELPAVLHRLLNAMGPDLAVLGRASLRAPILIAVACRAEDRKNLAPGIAQLSAERAESLRDSLPAQSAAPADRPAARREPPAEPLQFATGYMPVRHLLAPRFAAILAGAETAEARLGLAISSKAPVKFEELIRLGEGVLRAGCYELAALASLLRGGITVGVLDTAAGRWLAQVSLGTDNARSAVGFRVDFACEVAIAVTANNSDGPEWVDGALKSLALGRCDSPTLRPPPAYDLAALLGNAIPVTPAGAGVLVTAKACRSGYLFVGDLQPIGAGTFALEATVDCEEGRIALGLIDTRSDRWACQLVFEPGSARRGALLKLRSQTVIRAVISGANAEAGDLSAWVKSFVLERVDGGSTMLEGGDRIAPVNGSADAPQTGRRGRPAP